MTLGTIKQPQPLNDFIYFIDGMFTVKRFDISSLIVLDQTELFMLQHPWKHVTVVAGKGNNVWSGSSADNRVGRFSPLFCSNLLVDCYIGIVKICQ